MQIQPINNYNYSNTNFKSSIAVFPMVDGVLATEKKTCKTLLTKTELMLNSSLERGINAERDSLADKLIEEFGKWVKDFENRVKLFTCVGGGRGGNGELYSFGYFVTKDERQQLIKEEEKLVEAKRKSGGYITAERKMAEDDYRCKNSYMVRKAFRNFNPNGDGPYALVPKFETVRDRNGIRIDGKYKYTGAEFRRVNPKTLTLQLDK